MRTLHQNTSALQQHQKVRVGSRIVAAGAWSEYIKIKELEMQPIGSRLDFNLLVSGPSQGRWPLRQYTHNLTRNSTPAL